MVLFPKHNFYNSVPQSSHIESVRDFLTSGLDQQIDPKKNSRQDGSLENGIRIYWTFRTAKRVGGYL
jgi:hypothetical protein